MLLLLRRKEVTYTPRSFLEADYVSNSNYSLNGQVLLLVI